MSEKTRLRKGEAKIQFIACGERIAALRASGLDIKATYKQLVEENLITMTYTGFYENFTQRQKRRSRKGLTEAAGIQVASPPAATALALPTIAGPPSAPPPEPKNFAVSPVKPVLPVPQQRPSALTVSDRDERRKAIQASLDNAIEAHRQHLNDSGDDPEMEQLKKTLI